MINATFLHLLKTGDPAALAILSYHVAELSHFENMWWLRGIGSSVNTAIAQIIGEEWRPYLHQPS